MTRYYIDACIWRDYWENRSDRFRPLGEWAFRFLKLVVEHGDEILVSDRVLRELLVYYSREQMQEMLSVAFESLVRVENSRTQVDEARKLSKELVVPFGDALHAVLARDNDAILISRDRHFSLLLDIADCRKPEDLL